MKTSYVGLLSLSVSCLGLALAGCHNPADDVAEAETGEAQEASSSGSADGRVYVFSPESTIGFVGSKVTGSHEGGFKNFSGQFKVADGEIQPGDEIMIDMESTWSDSDRLTGHLKNEDFFNVPEFPISTFTPTKIVKEGETHKVTGNLTLHGVTKSITFPADITVAEDEVKVGAEFFINRFDFDIKYKGKADDLIRDEVVIRLNIMARPA